MRLINSMASFVTAIALVVIAVVLTYKHIYNNAKTDKACNAITSADGECSPTWINGICFKQTKNKGGDCVLKRDFAPLILFIIAFAMFVASIVFLFLK